MFKSKKQQPRRLLSLFLGLSLFLSGCVNPNKPDSLTFKLLAVPMDKLLNWTAHFFNGNYGLAIIIMTLLVRLILLPLTMKQMRETTAQGIRMRAFQPQLKVFQERQKAAQTEQEKMQVMQEQQKFFQENNISMLGGVKGCLPLLIQLPIFTALYSAIRVSDNIKNYTFLGIALGKPSIVLGVLTILLYALQSWISLQGIPEEQRQTMKWSMLSMPIMMAFIVFTTPAGLTLYFFVSALLSILQSVYTTYIFRPRITAQVEKEMAENPIKTAPISPRQDVTHTADQETENKKAIHKPKKKRRRNEGKQKR